MIYQIGICDDENSTCSELENILIDYFKVSGLNVQVNVWNCAEDFMRDVPLKVKVDLLFLDIELPNYNGIYVGEYIRNDINNYAMHIIYVSSKTNYAMELFKIHPYDFIIKPIDKEKVIKNVSKLLELDEQDNNYFVYEYNRIKNKIHYGDIVYFESDRKHIKIICSMVAQSFIINIRHIRMFKKDSCIMDNGDCINIGRKYKDAFNIKMIEYNKRGGNG